MEQHRLIFIKGEEGCWSCRVDSIEVRVRVHETADVTVTQFGTYEVPPCCVIFYDAPGCPDQLLSSAIKGTEHCEKTCPYKASVESWNSYITVWGRTLDEACRQAKVELAAFRQETSEQACWADVPAESVSQGAWDIGGILI